jgi:phage gp29-like protein
MRFAAPRAGKGQRFTKAQQAVEDLAGAALGAAKTPIAPNKIAAALRAAKDPEDLAGRLASVYEGDDATEFRDILERALFAADLMGYVHNTEQDDLDATK